MIEVKFDSNSFHRKVEEMANRGVQRIADNAQAELDQVFQQHAGDDVEVILPHLRNAIAQVHPGGDRRFDFRPWAEAISAGKRIVLKTEPVRL